MIIVKQFTFSPVQENTYVVYNEDREACIIDPGCYYLNERNQLKELIEKTGLQPKYLLNTHCHLDHVFGNKFIHETYGLLLHLHPMEEKVLAFAPTSGEMWGLPFENYEGPYVFLEEGDQINLGTDNFQILLTPGHSPGSICFYNKEQQIVIAGDVLFRESIGRTDLPGGDHETLLNSIRRKLFVLPDEVVVYPGHGPSTTIGYEKINNPFL
jgi:glyoxylase-like metal-dependent hydrolase (beta-lactamase superfamily II)